MMTVLEEQASRVSVHVELGVWLKGCIFAVCLSPRTLGSVDEAVPDECFEESCPDVWTPSSFFGGLFTSVSVDGFVSMFGSTSVGGFEDGASSTLELPLLGSVVHGCFGWPLVNVVSSTIKQHQDGIN